MIIDQLIFSAIQLVMGVALLLAGFILAINAGTVTVPILTLAVALLFLKDGAVIVLSAYVTVSPKEAETPDVKGNVQ